MRRRTRRQSWARAAAVLAVTAASATAASQPAPQAGAPPPAAVDATVAAVKAHYAAGRAAADGKQWQKAVDEFSKAFALKPLPQIAGNLGEAELQVGRFRDAAEHIALFLREDKGATSEDKKAAQGWLAEAKKKIVTLKITVEDAGSEVLVDDRPIGVSPLPPEVYVDPGRHTIVARKGTARAEVTDTYEAGWTRVMKLVPKEPAVAPPAATGTAGPTVPVGGAGDATSSAPRKGLVIGGAVAGGVLVVAGAVLAGVSASKAGEADGKGGWDKCYDGTGYHQDCAALNGLRNDAAISGNFSTGMFVGAALVGTATILYVLRILPPGSSPKKTGLSAAPIVAPSAGGISVAGSF